MATPKEQTYTRPNYGESVELKPGGDVTITRPDGQEQLAKPASKPSGK